MVFLQMRSVASWKCYTFPNSSASSEAIENLHSLCSAQLNMRACKCLGPPKNECMTHLFQATMMSMKNVSIFYSCSYSLFQSLFLILVRKHLVISSSHLAKPRPKALTRTTLTTLQVPCLPLSTDSFRLWFARVIVVEYHSQYLSLQFYLMKELLLRDYLCLLYCLSVS